MLRRRFSFPFAICLLILATGCSDDDPVSLPETALPVITAPEVALNPHNALSLLVAFRVENADSVRLVFQAPGLPAEATPRCAVTEPALRLAALGLLPETDYALVVEATRGAETARSDTLRATSGALPAFLAEQIAIEITGTPPEGYIATNTVSNAANRYMYLFDETGRIVWYRHFDLLVGFSEQLPNGNFGAFSGLSQGFQPTYGYYAEISPAGEEVRRHQAVAPFYTDGHELLLTPRGDEYEAHLFSYSLREIDMTPYGGRPDALIGGHQLLRFSPGGSLEFMWNAWDHFDIADWIELPESRRQAANADFDHPNALAIDHDGNYIASFRDLAEVTKIDSRTGAIIWRFGGNNNQFTIVGDYFDGFSGQHSVRVMDNGNLLLYDNGLRHFPQTSRAVEYALDTTTMTATLVWEYLHSTLVYTPFTGGVTRRTNGNTVVQYAGRGFVVEVDPAGDVVWTGTVTQGGSVAGLYRMVPVPSLYTFIAP